MIQLATEELVPHHSLTMEMATLGSAMIEHSMADAIKPVLPHPGYFYRPSHQRIWKAILDLRKDNLPTDLEFVIERLGSDIQDIGGEDYLIQVAEYVPSCWNGVYYAGEVAKHWARREYNRILRNLEPETNLDELHIALGAVRNGIATSTATPIVQTLGSLQNDAVKGLPTGWKAIDDAFTCKGWPKGQFVLIRADTGLGKTPFLTQACIEAARMGRNPLYATFADLSAQELQARAMKYLTGWSHPPDSAGLNALWFDEKQTLQRLGIDVYDASSMETGFDIETFAAWFDANQPEKEYTEIYFDYLQEIKTRYGGTILEQITIVCAQIKTTSKKHDIGSIAASQVTLGKEGHGDITKGGRVAGEKAAVVLDIKPNDENDGGEFRLPKNRFGPRNVKIPYKFNQDRLAYVVTQ